MWFALIDPAWRPSAPEDSPPSSQMVGGWRLDTEGRPGPFEPNPQYLPANGEGPTDPIDYGLRMAARGEPVGDQLIAMVRDSVVEIVCDEQGRPRVGPAPGEAPCVLVATSPAAGPVAAGFPLGAGGR
ncbi:type VII secretion system-associated protein [Nonomuraea antimicrobica]